MCARGAYSFHIDHVGAADRSRRGHFDGKLRAAACRSGAAARGTSRYATVASLRSAAGVALAGEPCSGTCRRRSGRCVGGRRRCALRRRSGSGPSA